MRLFHRLYQRTYRDCGYNWTVTRAQAQLRPNKLRLYPSAAGVAAIQAAEAAMDSRLELIEQFHKCAKCGSELFSERPVTKRHPADPPMI